MTEHLLVVETESHPPVGALSKLDVARALAAVAGTANATINASVPSLYASNLPRDHEPSLRLRPARTPATPIARSVRAA